LSFGEVSITKKQIASICFCTEDEIKVSTADVQKQWGGNDCGLFAAEVIYPRIKNFCSNSSGGTKSVMICVPDAYTIYLGYF
jgi:hypothetical protein